MSSTDNHYSLLQLLRQQLESAKAHDEQIRAQNAAGQRIQVPGTGKAITAAYEQLRNAAEYTEEHLLLQRAIKRFFKRNFSFFSKHSLKNIGEELIVELTQAGYLGGSQFSLETAAHITGMATESGYVYAQLRKAHISRDEATDWILGGLSVDVESILNPHATHRALAAVAYQHFLRVLPKDSLLQHEDETAAYEICLYIAVHQALLKSDLAIVRQDLMLMYQQTNQDIPAFIEFNQKVTQLFTAHLTVRLKRAVSKNSAAFRILKSMTDDRTDLQELLQDRSAFLEAFNRQVVKEYRQVNARLNKGIIKSIIFIFITKVIIGIGIEVPYDLLTVGSIALIPLGINLLFPPLYMATLRLGLKPPTNANAAVLRENIDQILFGDDSSPLLAIRGTATHRVSTARKLIYSLLFLVPFAVTVYVLVLLHFNIVQMVIFFAFLSTASFLGFRLSSMVRELELVSPNNRFLSTIRDFFYLPFILVGQWLSSKYARINAVAHILDIAIELPLKTVLRLTRQWTRFLNEKHDEIY